MKIILQLSLFVALWNHVELWGLDCVKFENLDLRIPRNPTVLGMGKKNGTWYTHIYWFDLPAGDLTLSYKLENWHVNSGTWRPSATEPVEIFTEGSAERHDIAKFVRKALGLTLRYTEIPSSDDDTIYGQLNPVENLRHYDTGPTNPWINFTAILSDVPSLFSKRALNISNPSQIEGEHSFVSSSPEAGAVRHRPGWSPVSNKFCQRLSQIQTGEATLRLPSLLTDADSTTLQRLNDISRITLERSNQFTMQNSHESSCDSAPTFIPSRPTAIVITPEGRITSEDVSTNNFIKQLKYAPLASLKTELKIPRRWITENLVSFVLEFIDISKIIKQLFAWRLDENCLTLQMIIRHNESQKRICALKHLEWFNCSSSNFQELRANIINLSISPNDLSKIDFDVNEWKAAAIYHSNEKFFFIKVPQRYNDCFEFDYQCLLSNVIKPTFQLICHKLPQSSTRLLWTQLELMYTRFRDPEKIIGEIHTELQNRDDDTLFRVLKELLLVYKKMVFM